MPVSFREILDAFQFVSVGGGFGEHQAFLCRQTGKFNPIGICSCDYPCVALIIEVERDQRFIICEKCLRFLYQYRRRFRQCCEIGKALQNLLAL